MCVCVCTYNRFENVSVTIYSNYFILAYISIGIRLTVWQFFSSLSAFYTTLHLRIYNFDWFCLSSVVSVVFFPVIAASFFVVGAGTHSLVHSLAFPFAAQSFVCSHYTYQNRQTKTITIGRMDECLLGCLIMWIPCHFPLFVSCYHFNKYFFLLSHTHTQHICKHISAVCHPFNYRVLGKVIYWRHQHKETANR